MTIKPHRLDLIVERAQKIDQLLASGAPDCEWMALYTHYKGLGLVNIPKDLRAHLPAVLDPRICLDEQIISCIKEHKIIQFKMLAQQLRMGQKQMQPILQRLWHRGKVFRVQIKHHTFYFVDKAQCP